MKTRSKKETNERKHFDVLATSYDINYGYDSKFTRYKIHKKIASFVAAVRNNFAGRKLKILELGCGTGEYSREIAKAFPESDITCLDISPGILKIARQKCRDSKNVHFVLGSAFSTNFRKKQFDVICGFYVLHHLDIRRTIREIKRILKGGGVAYFYEPNILNPIVFLVKSSGFLKARVGDSPDEWAINPLTIPKLFTGFRSVNINLSEYVLPLQVFPFNLMKVLDKITDVFKYIPILKFVGGSVMIVATN